MAKKMTFETLATLMQKEFTSLRKDMASKEGLAALQKEFSFLREDMQGFKRDLVATLLALRDRRVEKLENRVERLETLEKKRG